MKKDNLFAGDYKTTPLWDDNLTEKERIDYLLGELTLEEKFQSLGTGSPEIPRLGIPAFGVGGEGAHGVLVRRNQRHGEADTCYTTVFPNPIGMSATWDRELIKQAGNVVGKEARALYHSGKHRSLSLWAPTVDLNRDPRWGRLEECYGEDGYLTGEMAGAYVDGMQGDEANFLQCAATAKHFYANNMEEGRTYISSSVDWRNKFEYYLEPFRKLIQEHRLEGMMTAYNEINGVPCMLLEKDLALVKDWGLGHVVCDGGDVGQTVDFHKYFSRHSETIAAGLKAHIDCFTDDIHLVSEAAKEAYQHGMITEEEIDRALFSYFRTMLRLGFFDKEGKNPYTKTELQVVSCQEHRELARRVTAESVVLLKNEQVKERGNQEKKPLLPLSGKKIAQGEETLAVLGPLCNTWDMGWYSGFPVHGITPWQGIKEAVSEENPENKGDNRYLWMETGISEVKIRLKTGRENSGKAQGQTEKMEEEGREEIQGKDWYLGILSDGETVGAVSREHAETFLLDQWEHGKVTLKAKSNGRFLTLKDDEEEGEQGHITATSTQAFGWFVREMFHLKGEDDALQKELSQGKTCFTGTLTTWDEAGIVLDKKGALRKESMCPLEEAVSVRWELQYEKDGIRAAVELAKKADKVVLCLGAHPMITCKEEIDRPDIQLAEYQQEMLQKVTEVNSHVILALISSVPFGIFPAMEQAPAILTMATGSMELGLGLADVLLGKASTGGRLNVTWYQSESDLPEMNDYDVIQGERTYQYFQGKTLYPFGHGLTYSPFDYGELQVKKEGLSGSFTVKNVGSACSDEVVQVYVKKCNSSVKRPEKTLVYFERLKDMQPGEKRRVSFEISLSQLMYYDVISQKMLMESGSYEVMAGASSEDIRQRQIIVLEGEERGIRDGENFIPAECYDTAINHVLRRGHLSYQAVCSKNSSDEIFLKYDRVMVNRVPEILVLDFWQEYPCDIFVEVNGEQVGKYRLEDPFAAMVEKGQEGGLTEREQQERTTKIGEATGAGSFEAHQNWLTRRREIGFREISVPLRKEKIPTGELFTLSIRWRGKGKLCMFRFS